MVAQCAAEFNGLKLPVYVKGLQIHSSNAANSQNLNSVHEQFALISSPSWFNQSTCHGSSPSSNLPLSSSAPHPLRLILVLSFIACSRAGYGVLSTGPRSLGTRLNQQQVFLAS